jgi:DNA-binding YbaB/EbfC family protein
MDMQQLMKQAQQMQKQLETAQAGLSDERVEATAGGGMVAVTANGNGEILGIKIDPEALDPDDVEMLEDMVLAAVNEAHRMASDLAQAKLGPITGGMGLPF